MIDKSFIYSYFPIPKYRCKAKKMNVESTALVNLAFKSYMSIKPYTKRIFVLPKLASFIVWNASFSRYTLF